jgi:hypothetical protein
VLSETTFSGIREGVSGGIVSEDADAEGKK